MTHCERLSDRMPLVALGRERWTPEEEVHIASCSDCGAEWDLLRGTRALGQAAPKMAERPELAAAVLRRVAQAPRARPARRAAGWAVGLAAAAGIAIAVWAGGPTREAATAPPYDSAAAADELGAAELDSLLQDDDPVAGWTMLEMPGLGDLDEDELERVLSTWEG